MVDAALHYYQELRRFLIRNVDDLAAAEDITQESYVRMLQMQRLGQPIAQPRSLLYRIAKNLVTDRLRHMQHHRIKPLEDWEAQDGALVSHDMPQESLQRKQTAQAYVDTIRTLPPRCREAFMLHLYEGMTHHQIASHMGISTSMVEKHLLRAMTACRKCERESGA